MCSGQTSVSGEEDNCAPNYLGRFYIHPAAVESGTIGSWDRRHEGSITVPAVFITALLDSHGYWKVLYCPCAAPLRSYISPSFFSFEVYRANRYRLSMTPIASKRERLEISMRRTAAERSRTYTPRKILSNHRTIRQGFDVVDGRLQIMWDVGFRIRVSSRKCCTSVVWRADNEFDEQMKSQFH